jgi:hypothetical protein
MGAAPTVDVKHRNWGVRLNQGNVGACTGFTGAHALNHSPLRQAIRPGLTQRAMQALAFYSRASQLDPWPGSYPPNDTGSSGLAVCKAMQELAHISGYQWAFGFTHGLSQIAQGPLMQGTEWTYSMMVPDRDGRCHPTGDLAGGHEYLWVGVDVAARRSWFLNSWGLGWGGAALVAGRRGHFYLTWDDHAALLARDGDLVRPLVRTP